MSKLQEILGLRVTDAGCEMRVLIDPHKAEQALLDILRDITLDIPGETNVMIAMEHVHQRKILKDKYGIDLGKE